MQTKRPFFIVGTPRSGTTLLQAMFMASPGLYIPPETQFLGVCKRSERTHGPPARDAGLDNIIKEVLAVCERHELPVDPGTLELELRACRRTYADLFDTLLWHIRTRCPGCRRLGEKSPVHLLFVPELLEMFPDSQVITVIRDGRDVALSQEESLERKTLRAALGWRRDQRLHAGYVRTLPPSRYTRVRYEDLVTQPPRELRRLCAFLDEPFCHQMLQPHLRPEKGFADWERHKALTMRPLTTTRIGRYRGQLSRSKIALVQAVAGAQLRANGYPLERVPPLAGYLRGAGQLPDLLLTQARNRRPAGTRGR